MEFLAFSQTKLGSSFDITRARVNKASVIPLLSSFVFSVPPSRRKVLGAKSKQAGKKEGGLGNSAFPLRNQIVDSPATCPNTWRAEPRKKNTNSFFKRNFTPAKSEMQGVFFLSGLPSRARRWRGFRSSRISDKIGSSEVVKTLQFCRKRHRRPQSVGRASRVPRSGVFCVFFYKTGATSQD